MAEIKDIDLLKFDERGLIPAVVVDNETKQVLTLAYMNRESLDISLEKGLTCFFSRSRQELGLKGIRCEHLRAEDAGRDKKHREKYDYVTARAVARLSVLSEYCLPLAKKGGQFIALKGSKFAEEITEGEAAVKILGGKILSAEPVKLPGLDDGRAIIKIAKIKSTPAQYPRKAGTPEKQPLGAK